MVGMSEDSYIWDALSDSLWERLFELPDRRIAILWPGAASLARWSPTAHQYALFTLHTVSQQLADVDLTVGRPKDVAVMIGTGRGPRAGARLR
jgi:hypothetical protein